MNPSYSTLLDARISNISRVTELWENTYLPLEAIAVQTGLSLKLVTTIVEETGVRRLRAEPLGKSPTSFGIHEAQIKLILDLYNTTLFSVKDISKQQGVYLKYSQVLKLINGSTTKEERNQRRIRGVRERGGLNIFKRHGKREDTTVTITEPLENRLLYSLRIIPGMTIPQLQTIYRFAINTTLPSLAKQNQWPIHLNHCFARVVLDTLFQDCWYNHLDRNSTAYRQLRRTQLLAAINIIEGVILDPSTLADLNELSKSYRSNS